MANFLLRMVQFGVCYMKAGLGLLVCDDDYFVQVLAYEVLS